MSYFCGNTGLMGKIGDAIPEFTLGTIVCTALVK